MQLPPPPDVTRWALRALKLLDDARKVVWPQPKQPERPEEPDRSRPEIW